ncbi:uncharacterized protein LOC144665664 isoform X1 [Oculina patagonica]
MFSPQYSQDMNSGQDEKEKETNYCGSYLELPEEVKRDLLNFPNESSNIDESLTIVKEDENEVRNSKSSFNSNNNILKEFQITAVWHNPNKTRNGNLARDIPLNRENVKKEFPQDSEHVAQKENVVENFSSTQVKKTCKEEYKPSNTPCSTDEIGISIDDSRTVRFRNNLFVAIEELRIQRTLELENEERIKTLMTERHELERRKEEEISKNNALVEQHAQQEIDIKKQQEDRLLQCEEDKAKLALSAECTEKELKVLKDEVRALHLVKYNLEKKIKEQDRLIQLQNSARDSHESQISALEQRSKKALDQCTVLADLVEKTETRISEASRLHRKLMYTNEHRKCLLESYKKELESKKFELVALKAAVAQKNDSSMHSTEEERSRADALERELQMQNEVRRKSQNQLEDSRKENEKLMQSLKEAHKLLNRHVQSINKHCELEAVAHLELDEIKTECQTLKQSLGKEQEEKQRLEDTLKCKNEEWDDQKQALESRLEDQQKEYESLSEAHNSLEQLNSNWSEQNMEQKTKIESMVKEVHDLTMRLAQAVESIKSQEKTNEELKNTYSNEISSLKETLQHAKQDYKSETERAESLDNQSTLMRKKIENLEKELIEKERELVLNKKEVKDTTSQTEDSFCEQISSLSEKLLQATQRYTNQTERADYLEDQCALLKEKVNDLLLRVAQKDEKHIKNVETTDNAVQTDDTSKINSYGPQNENSSPFPEDNRIQDQSINKPPGKNRAQLQNQEEKTCKDMDMTLKKKNVETLKPMTAATENTKENNKRKLLCGIDQSTWQLKVKADSKAVEEKAKKCVAPGDTTSCDEVNKDDKGNSSLNYGNGQISQKALINQEGVSTKTAAIATTLGMDVLNIASPPELLSNSIGFEESSNTTQCIGGLNRGMTKDFTDLPKTDELSVGLESAVADGNSEYSSSCQDLVKGDTSEPGKKSQTSAISVDEESKKKEDITDTSGAAEENTSRKVKPRDKRVRFNLEGNKPSDTQTPNGSEEISRDEPQMMFSDEEDAENKCRSIDEDVSQRISRIQNLLRSDRLRTNRKRKFPVV